MTNSNLSSNSVQPQEQLKTGPKQTESETCLQQRESHSKTPKTVSRSSETDYGSDEAFCTAAGAASPRPSAKKGNLRKMFNEADRA